MTERYQIMVSRSGDVRNSSRKAITLTKLGSLLLLLFVFNCCAERVAAQSTAYCSAYCDIYDNLIEGSYCESTGNEIYCCGTTYNKTCCTDRNSAVNAPEVTACGHSWMYYQWSLIYGLVAVLMVILMIVICCICCRGYQIVSRRTASSGSRQERDESETDRQSLGFDPSCEYAFEPPRYETLPKDPPKYSEVFSPSISTTEHDNAAFTIEDPAGPSQLETTTTFSQVEEETPSCTATDSPNHRHESSTESEEEVRNDGPVVITVEDENRNETGNQSAASSI